MSRSNPRVVIQPPYRPLRPAPTVTRVDSEGAGGEQGRVASTNIRWHEGKVTRDERWAALGHRGATVWLTGLSGSGKSTLAVALEHQLVARKVACYRLDGDNLRHGLNADLGFGEADRNENVRRAGEVAQLFADSGAVAVSAFISPYAAARQHIRGRHEAAGLPFLEVFVDTPLAVCESRDPKGLYGKARRGELTGMTGLDAPYEAPAQPDLRIDGGATSVEDGVEAIIQLLAGRGILSDQG
ncbi:MAG: adenylyl-sulfate kinase [Myxococcales bacterium]|nr:adenylyl-sulfate kinase [Myxococcales bacterium]